MAEETCPNCGAVYEVKYVRMPIPDTDTVECDVCGERLAAWSNATQWPEYTLVKRPDGR
ncbi:MJ0042-type zinc finger domain-containing protein [Bradyrhizobium sp. SZCCHNR2028]